MMGFGLDRLPLGGRSVSWAPCMPATTYLESRALPGECFPERILFRTITPTETYAPDETLRESAVRSHYSFPVSLSPRLNLSTTPVLVPLYLHLCYLQVLG